MRQAAWFILFLCIFNVFPSGCASKKSATDSTNTKRFWNSGGEKGNPQNEFQQYAEAARSGNANATHRLAMCYMDGKGVERDFVQGFETLLQAAELGNLESKYRVALCYSQGIGTPQNEAEAVLWMTTAAREQHKGAREWLAKRGIFLEGDRRAVAANPSHPLPPYGSDPYRPVIQTYSAQGQTAQGGAVQVNIQQDINPWNDPELIRKREREQREEGTKK